MIKVLKFSPLLRLSDYSLVGGDRKEIIVCGMARLQMVNDATTAEIKRPAVISALSMVLMASIFM